jgi:hypothetical protein
VGERGNPRAEIVGDAFQDLNRIDQLLLRRSADALEAMSDTFQALDVVRHMADRALTELVTLAIHQQFDPAGQTRDRRSQLVCGLTRHARPHAFAIGTRSRLHCVTTRQEQHRQNRDLRHRNHLEPRTSRV